MNILDKPPNTYLISMVVDAGKECSFRKITNVICSMIIKLYKISGQINIY